MTNPTLAEMCASVIRRHTPYRYTTITLVNGVEVYFRKDRSIQLRYVKDRKVYFLEVDKEGGRGWHSRLVTALVGGITRILNGGGKEIGMDYLTLVMEEQARRCGQGIMLQHERITWMVNNDARPAWLSWMEDDELERARRVGVYYRYYNYSLTIKRWCFGNEEGQDIDGVRSLFDPDLIDGLLVRLAQARMKAAGVTFPLKSQIPSAEAATSPAAA